MIIANTCYMLFTENYRVKKVRSRNVDTYFFENMHQVPGSQMQMLIMISHLCLVWNKSTLAILNSDFGQILLHIAVIALSLHLETKFPSL